MVNLDEYRNAIVKMSQQDLKTEEKALKDRRNSLNTTQFSSLDQVEKIEKNLEEVRFKLQLVRAYID